MKFIELVLFEMNFIKNRHTTQIKILFHSINLYDSSRYKFFLTFAKKKKYSGQQHQKIKKRKKILLLFSLLQTALPMLQNWWSSSFWWCVDDDDWRNSKNERKNGNENFILEELK